MDTSAELLAKVLAAPLDDAPRRAYADHLAAQGNPRGEFIATQLSLRTPLDPGRRAELRERVRTLLRAHEQTWVAPLKKAGATAWRFSRGFVEEISIDARKLAAATAIFDLEPIRWVRVDASGDIEALARSPVLARLTALRVTGEIGDEGAQALAESEHLSGLLNLNLGSTGVGEEGAAALAESEGLSSLQRLSLTGNELGDEGGVALAESETLKVDHLYLARTGVGVETAAALAKRGRSLKVLALGGNSDLGDEGAEALAKGKALAGLERLELNLTDLREEGAKALAKSPHLAHLKWLQVSDNFLGDASRKVLAARFGTRVRF